MRSALQPERVVEALLALLAEEPELRVGQAVAIATKKLVGEFDPFNVSDPELAKMLERLAAESRQRRSAR